jgi:hypothetical protein
VRLASGARVDWPKASTTSTGSVTKGSLQYSENIAHRVLSTTYKAPQCRCTENDQSVLRGHPTGPSCCAVTAAQQLPTFAFVRSVAVASMNTSFVSSVICSNTQYL